MNKYDDIHSFYDGRQKPIIYLIAGFSAMIIIILPLCLLILSMLIILPLFGILYLLSLLMAPFTPHLNKLEFYIYKKLVDYDCCYLINYTNSSRQYEICNYAETQGKVNVYLNLKIRTGWDNELKPIDIVRNIKGSLTRNKLLFFENGLYLLDNKTIIDLYNRNNNVKGFYIMLSHLFKKYTIQLFLKQLHYEFNDLKPIIYNYYLQLLLT